MISGISANLAALSALAKKVESSANNVANINTDSFKKTRVLLEEETPQGVTARVEKINDPGAMAYEQTPAGETLVEQSNVELTEELPNLLLTKRFFEANLKTIKTQDEMLGSLLDIKG